jgi:hypothetical protein
LHENQIGTPLPKTAAELKDDEWMTVRQCRMQGTPYLVARQVDCKLARPNEWYAMPGGHLR